jgi:hypothetical protein
MAAGNLLNGTGGIIRRFKIIYILVALKVLSH